MEEPQAMQSNAQISDLKIETLIGLTPVKALSENVKLIADSLETAVKNNNQRQVAELAATGESLLKAITLLA